MLELPTWLNLLLIIYSRRSWEEFAVYNNEDCGIVRATSQKSEASLGS